MPSGIELKSRRIRDILHLAVKKYLEIDGSHWAAAFAHYAFFSLFPVIVLFVTVASAFVDRDLAGHEVIGYIERYVPIQGEMKSHIFDTVGGVVQARGQASAVAFLMLVWSAMQFFTTLICATNLAWGVEGYNWWRLPLKSLALLGIMGVAVLLGIGVPMLAKMARDWLFPINDLSSWVYGFGSFSILLLFVFLGLSLFYKLAPRRITRFAEIWPAALCSAFLLRAAESLFVIYLKSFAKLNAIYGAFGGIMALLLWIYLSGCIFVFGACLCAAQAEGRSTLAESDGAAVPSTEQSLRAKASGRPNSGFAEEIPGRPAQTVPSPCPKASTRPGAFEAS